jgi:hypothetical protein
VLEEPVALAQIAAAAGGHDVVPAVHAASAARDDVVEGLGRARAVLALVLVADEHRPPAQRHVALVGDPDELAEPDDRRHLDHEPLGVERDARLVDDLGLVGEDEHGRPPTRDDAEGLIGDVEHEGPAHGAEP